MYNSSIFKVLSISLLMCPMFSSAMEQDDYYQILGVPRTATTEEITRAYRKLAIKWHPDKNLGDRVAQERFELISRAYDTLKNQVNSPAINNIINAQQEQQSHTQNTLNSRGRGAVRQTYWEQITSNGKNAINVQPQQTIINQPSQQSHVQQHQYKSYPSQQTSNNHAINAQPQQSHINGRGRSRGRQQTNVLSRQTHINNVKNVQHQQTTISQPSQQSAQQGQQIRINNAINVQPQTHINNERVIQLQFSNQSEQVVSFFSSFKNTETFMSNVLAPYQDSDNINLTQNGIVHIHTAFGTFLLEPNQEQTGSVLYLLVAAQQGQNWITDKVIIEEVDHTELNNAIILVNQDNFITIIKRNFNISKDFENINDI